MKFKRGTSGNPSGRPRGSRSKVSAEVRALAGQIFNADYWSLKYERIHKGIEHPKIEELLLAYAYGSPPKEIHASGLVVSLGPLNALHGIALEDGSQGETLETHALTEGNEPNRG